MILRVVVTLIFSTAASVPASAVARLLDVKPTAGWQHAATGIIIMPTLAAMTRESIRDFGTQELDIALTYRLQASETTATIYLFRPAFPSVPIWFDRSRSAIDNSTELFANGVRGGEPVDFAAEGKIPAGLKAVYDARGRAGSSALAMVGVGDWLLAVRVTSNTLNSTGLNDQLGAILRGIRFPAQAATDRVIPVSPCPSALAFGHARQLHQAHQDSMMEALLGGALAAAPKTEVVMTPSQPVCRDAASVPAFGVYREPESTDAYLLALGDGGISVSVMPSLAGQIGLSKKKSFAVTRHDLDRDLTFAPYDRLPEPGTVAAMVFKAQPISITDHSSTSTTITLPTK